MNLLLEALKLKEIQYTVIKVPDNYLPYALIFRFIFEKLSKIQSLDFSGKLWVKLSKNIIQTRKRRLEAARSQEPP